MHARHQAQLSQQSAAPSIFFGGVFFRFFLDVFFAFGFLAAWLLGFSASWLLGFLASRLLGFSASCWFMRFHFSPLLHSQFLFGRWRFDICGFSLVYAAFGGFWRLWLFASSAFPVPLRAFWLLHPFISSSNIMGGLPPPTHPLLVRLLAE